MFENWPFTNFHDLNLDWILSKLGELKTSIDEAAASASRALLYMTRSESAAENAEASEQAAAGSAETAAGEAAYTRNMAAVINSNTARIQALEDESGTTVDNAEIAAARVGWTGQAYATLGDAVRTQTWNVSERTDNLIELYPLTGTNTGGTGYTVSGGIMNLTGSQGPNAQALVIADDFDIPAGDYTFTSYPKLEGGYFQVYRITNGNYDGQLCQTNTTATFNVTGTTTVRIRLLFNANANVSGQVIIPVLVAGNTAGDPYPAVTALDRIARTDIASLEQYAYTAGQLSGGEDFNDLTERKVYLMGYGASFTNDPIGSNKRRLLFVYKYYDSYIVQKAINYTEGEYQEYVRFLAGGNWSTWELVYSKGSNTVNTEIATALETKNENATPNTGPNISVVSYNVAHYNNDTAVYIAPLELCEVKKTLQHTGADFIGIQENRFYIDGANTKQCDEYIYKPVWPFYAGANESVIFSKTPASWARTMQTSTARMVEAATYNINGDVLLMVSAHPTANFQNTGAYSNDSINARLTEYREIFGFVNGDNPLDYGGVNVMAPAHKWFVICIDSNALTATDRTNLFAEAGNINAYMANGGAIGWIKTDKLGNAIDNIIVSNNCIINSFTAYQKEAAYLYSDHYPVKAEITLLA